MLDSAVAALIHYWGTDPEFRILFRAKPEEALRNYGIELSDEQRAQLDLPPAGAIGPEEEYALDSAA